MKRLFDEKPVGFAVMLIVIYVVGMSVALNLSEEGSFLPQMIFAAAMAVFIFLFAKKHDIMEYLGLCAPQTDAKTMLFYIPLVIIGLHGVYLGAGAEYGVLDSLTRTIMMLCVGFLEEVIFRGFLFKGIAKTDLKRAVIISSLTFGVGHMVNLANGQNTFDTIIQIIFAVAFGFMVVFVFMRTGSLIPCILVHGVFNSMSAFNNSAFLTDRFGETGKDLIITGITGAVIIAYTVYTARLPKKEIRL